ncbi:MAG: long-chain fatty acid--CoA ligase [bacterium]
MLYKNVTRISDILDGYRNQYSGLGNALSEKRTGKWKHYSAKDYVRICDELSMAFLEIGIKKGDRIGTVLHNSPEWNFIDMAIAQTGAVHVPIYPTIATETYKFIFRDAGIKLLFISFEEVYQRIKPVLKEVESLEQVFSIDFDAGIPKLNDLIRKGEESNRKTELIDLKRTIKTDDINSIIYTSGTTGTPKGVMLSHKNITSNAVAAANILAQNPVKTGLSFLPLCHVYERVINYTYQLAGVKISYVHNLEMIGDMIREVKPEMFCTVPRILEKTFSKIMDKGRDLPLLSKMIFYWALRVGEKYEPWEKRSAWYNFKLAIARKLVFSKWIQALGGNIDVVVCGGASLQDKLARLFWAAGIQVVEGYGLTETSPVIAVGQFIPGGVKLGTVGPILPGVNVKMADDGEILVKGPNVMKGYFNRPDLDKEVFDLEGWFHTGDIGVMEGKFLRITDRKKEIFKTSGGKYIAPQVIEIKFKTSPFIENIMVVGEGKNFASALIIPDFHHIESWCKVKGHPYEGSGKAIRNEIIIQRIEREVEELNEDLDKTEKIRKVVLLDDDWSVENQLLSPTLKLKRKTLVEKYQELIESIYEP